eukprot:2493182-Prymnesium_polylepis.1
MHGISGHRGQCTHRSENFGAWHRFYVLDLEDKLRAADQALGNDGCIGVPCEPAAPPATAPIPSARARSPRLVLITPPQASSRAPVQPSPRAAVQPPSPPPLRRHLQPTFRSRPLLVFCLRQTGTRRARGSAAW